MSTDQPTLDVFGTRAPHKERLHDAGAEYTGRGAGQPSTAVDERVCLTCGTAISPQLARVVGDNDGNIEVCHHCYVGPGNEPYSCASRAVRRYRAGYGRLKPQFQTTEEES